MITICVCCSGQVDTDGGCVPLCINCRDHLGLRTRDDVDNAVRLAFNDGAKVALVRYAWWKDGVQYVGCGMETLAEAMLEFQDDVPHV